MLFLGGSTYYLIKDFWMSMIKSKAWNVKDRNEDAGAKWLTLLLQEHCTKSETLIPMD